MGRGSYDSAELEEAYGPVVSRAGPGEAAGELSTVAVHASVRRENAIAGEDGGGRVGGAGSGGSQLAAGAQAPGCTAVVVADRSVGGPPWGRERGRGAEKLVIAAHPCL
jgi:hypothetical protein